MRDRDPELDVSGLACYAMLPSPNTPRSPTRTFTYRQIDEAVSTVANFLNAAGITNGDVVMIFAHRSVELVCAFMGILVRQPSLLCSAASRLLVLASS